MRRREKASRTERLIDFVPYASPRFERPLHLAPFVDLLERTRTEKVRLVCSTPPRHGKTESILHCIAWLLLKEPRLQIGYVSYAMPFARKRSRQAREIAKAVGVPMARDAQARSDWRTGVDQGGLWATSIAAGITGEGFHVIFVDDPVKDRAHAESAVDRDNVFDQFKSNIVTRLEPNGSCVVNMARWHPDDLAGRLLKEKDGRWQGLNLPALAGDTEALWPGRYSREQLEEIREELGDYAWSSLYQGNPKPRGGQLFKDVHFYKTLPETYRVGIGFDCAYSEKKRSDYSAIVVLAESAGTVYVLDVVRVQESAPHFRARLAAIAARYPGNRPVWYASTTERGMAGLFDSEDAPEADRINVDARLATADKFVRAQPAAALWNAGKVLLPERAPWLNDFVSEVCDFTGVKDRHDDQVDALAAARDALGNVAPTLADIPLMKRMIPPNRYSNGRPHDDWDD